MASTPDDPVAALPPLREVIAAHGLAARRALGQNFLLDLNLTRKIARAAAPFDGLTVVEVGPGPGGLTRALLLEGAETVVAIERDRRCIDALDGLSAAAGDRLRLIEGDALTINLRDIIAPPAIVVANLPYNIATALIMRWLEDEPLFKRFVVMLQKEVAQRLTADVGSKNYGRLGVMVQWRCETHALFDLPPRAFTPPPKVTSTVVELIPRATPLAPAPPAQLSAVVAAAFGQRRKMLRSSLKQLTPTPEVWLEQAGITPTLRAEDLSIEAFCRLATVAAGDTSVH